MLPSFRADTMLANHLRLCPDIMIFPRRILMRISTNAGDSRRANPRRSDLPLQSVINTYSVLLSLPRFPKLSFLFKKILQTSP